MTTTEYLMNIGLIGLVVIQIRGHKITRARMILPVVIVVWVASQFLHGMPTTGNDGVLEVGLALTGGVLGALAGLVTTVSRQGAGAFAKAGLAAAVLWVLGIGARMGFSVWVTHGGSATVGAFSAANHITSGAAWVGAFVLMAMVEVIVRTAVIYGKAVRSGAEIPRGGLLQNLTTA